MSNNQIQLAQKPADLMSYMKKFESQLAMALPQHIGADRLMRLAVTAWSQNGTLQKCSLQSIFGAVLTSAQLGLEIGVGGQGYLVPYKGKATFIPGWQGIVDLVARAGRAVVWTGAVYRGDHFDWALGDSPFVKHKPDSDSDAFEDLLYVYAIGRVNGAQVPVIEVWSKDRIIRHLNKWNKVGADHYALKDGFKNFEMYARKIPLLQVMKYMPKSIEVQRAIDVANAVDVGKDYTIDGEFVVIHNDENGSDDTAHDQASQHQNTPAQSVRSKSERVQQDQATHNQEHQKQNTAPVQHQDQQQGQPSNDMAAPGGPGDRPLSESEFDFLKSKMEESALGSADVLKRFGIKLEQLTAVNYRTVLNWVKNPVAA